MRYYMRLTADGEDWADRQHNDPRATHPPFA
jgi:hypothetical protein